MTNLVTDAPSIRANDLVMAKDMADALHTAYPGHLWAVNVNGDKGLADIYNLALSGDRAYRMHLNTIYSASEFKKDVLRAGGEILERFRVARARFNLDHYSTLPTDFAGRHKVDL